MDDLWGKLPIFGNTHMLNFGRVVNLFILAHPWSASMRLSQAGSRYALPLAITDPTGSKGAKRMDICDQNMVKIHSKPASWCEIWHFGCQKPWNFKFKQKESENLFVYSSFSFNFCLNACPSIAFCCHFAALFMFCCKAKMTGRSNSLCRILSLGRWRFGCFLTPQTPQNDHF